MELRELARLNGGYVESRILHAGVTLGLFDVLEDRGRTADDVARAAGTDPRATEVLLNAMVPLRLVRKDGELFRATDASRTLLRSDAPGSYAGHVRYDAALWQLWDGLSETVRRGTPAPAPNRLQGSADATARWIDGRASLAQARGDARVLAESITLEDATRLLDVAAGPGLTAVELCRRHPALTIALLDLPGTLVETSRHLATVEPATRDRIALVAGDWRHDPWPTPVDLVLLADVVRGEDEATNRALVRAAWSALAPGGRLLIKDHVLDESGTSPAAGALASVAMLLYTGGRAYAFADLRAWCLDAGFQSVETDVLPPGLSASLVVARK
jgi:SAM-dependent methyltransferase